MEREEVRFASGGPASCAGSLFLPQGAEGPVPCVVMGSGLSCVRDQGMGAFAERFAAAGFAGLAIDYRHFGDSGGEPRGLVTGARQRQDLRAALAFAGRGRSSTPTDSRSGGTRWAAPTCRPSPSRRLPSPRRSASRP